MLRFQFALVLASLCLFQPLRASFGSIAPSTADMPPKLAADHIQQQDPLMQLDQLIAATNSSLADQRALRKQLVEHQKCKAAYMQNCEDRQLALQLVKTAEALLKNIETHHLTYLFDQKSLEELRFFSKIARKKGLPRPG